MNYKKTLNLPQTNFPMKANLPEREPEILQYWEKINLYQSISKKLKNNKKYILHDGPPYSNGPIHLGQALNKILKDIIVKYKTLEGYNSPFVPGWDTHGLPIERVAIESFKINRKEIDPVLLRKKCFQVAKHYLEIQKEQFKRLGIRGDWENSYLTFDHSYEATVINTFKNMVKNGFIYRNLKPVCWCWECETALAEAEIEYKDKTSPSIYVKFEINEDLKDLFPEWNEKTYVLIWTTTPWTLPGNMAIAFHPDFDYILVKVKNEGYILAKELLHKVMEEIKIKDYQIIGEVKGKKLEKYSAKHPFLKRNSVFILMGYVTLGEGSGCVHTAPGFGREDFEAGLKYNLPTIVPLDHAGILTEEAGIFAGLHHLKANKKITEHLNKTGNLLSEKKIKHSYAHCWRCKEPIVYRATKQWFVAIDVKNLRGKALEAINNVSWIPKWGHERIYNMVQSRPDWCISRQRIWGVPIPAFYCKNCEEVILDANLIERVENIFSQKGTDAWFEMNAEDILPEGFKCPLCKATKFQKEMNIFDVWFESGISHEAVCGKREELQWPADLYLEGSDQHRGWFQLSLLPAMAVREQPPYRTVLTHGWVLDEQGVSMHKSAGNVIDPADIIKNYGADILRLFFASVDYTSDIKIGKDALTQVAENYKKIRNTCRFMLGNLYDFNPETDFINDAELHPLDKWILNETSHLIEKIKKAYEQFQFHLVYYYLHNFCTQNLSSFYLDIIKDRLYTHSAKSLSRKSAQRALYEILNTLTIIMCPVLSYTAEDLYQHFPWEKKHLSVQLEGLTLLKSYLDKDEEARWDIILSLREEIFLAMEKLRENKEIRQSNEVEITCFLEEALFNLFRDQEKLLKEVFMAASLKILSPASGIPEGTIVPKAYPKIKISIEKTKWEKCTRCWNYVERLSKEDRFKDVCEQCAEVLKESGENINE